jgi:hypothetical protein
MTRLNLIFAPEQAPPEPKWPPHRVLMWSLLFACLSLWVTLAMMR